MKLLPLVYTMIILLLAILLSIPALADDVDEYIADLKKPDSTIREDAASALGRMNDPSAVDPLIKALGDRDVVIRSMSAISLGLLSNPRAVEPLISALDDENISVRTNAAVSLGKQ